MQELNLAYEEKDLEKVKSLLNSLKSGESFDLASDSIQDKDKLRDRILAVKETINTIIEEIDAIKNAETYQKIQEIEDIEEYFQDLKAQLKEEKQYLEDELIQISSEKTVTNKTNKENDFSENIDDEDDFFSREF